MEQPESVDIVVIGSGISGIGAAHHILTALPSLKCIVLERRATFGGTWDLFKYPGLRSDSDMFTFGFEHRPWTDTKPIAPAADILAYLNGIVTDEGLHRCIRYGEDVVTAKWRSETRRWHLTCANGKQYVVWFLYACAGYYDHERWHAPEFPGVKDFEDAGGIVIHPQAWPEEFDYSDKRIAVIGSGATAITLVPALASKASLVTMIQRSPSYILPLRNVVDLALEMTQEGAPLDEIHRRVRSNRLEEIRDMLSNVATVPKETQNKFFIDVMRSVMPGKYMRDEEFRRHFTPTYNVWEQRVCVAPDGDFFRVIRRQKAKICTGVIHKFDSRGILMKSGDRVDADVIVSATGLELHENPPMASIRVSIDDKPYNSPDHFMYKSCMISDVPNFVFCKGYFQSSWTLKAETTSKFLCRLLIHMQKTGNEVVLPRIPADGLTASLPPNLKSGYFLRNQHRLLKCGMDHPWMHVESIDTDKELMLGAALEDGVLSFTERKGHRIASAL